jgi:hypothetical protein
MQQAEANEGIWSLQLAQQTGDPFDCKEVTQVFGPVMSEDKLPSLLQLPPFTAADRPDEIPPDVWALIMQFRYAHHTKFKISSEMIVTGHEQDAARHRTTQHSKSLGQRRPHLWIPFTETLMSRDCKLELDRQASSAWQAVSTTVAQLDGAESEVDAIHGKLQSHTEAQALRSANRRLLEQSVPIVFSVLGGQMELMRHQVLPDFSDAVMLNRAIVSKLNAAIVGKALEMLSLQTDCSKARQAAHLTAWQIKLDELAVRNKGELVKELQLIRVGRDVGEILQSKGDQANTQSTAKQTESLLEHQQHMHVCSPTFLYLTYCSLINRKHKRVHCSSVHDCGHKMRNNP